MLLRDYRILLARRCTRGSADNDQKHGKAHTYTPSMAEIVPRALWPGRQAAKGGRVLCQQGSQGRTTLGKNRASAGTGACPHRKAKAEKINWNSGLCNPSPLLGKQKTPFLLPHLSAHNIAEYALDWSRADFVLSLGHRSTPRQQVPLPTTILSPGNSFDDEARHPST